MSEQLVAQRTPQRNFQPRADVIKQKLVGRVSASGSLKGNHERPLPTPVQVKSHTPAQRPPTAGTGTSTSYTPLMEPEPKRQRAGGETLSSLPDVLLGLVCGFLSVQDTLPVLSLVLRRSKIKVPWTQVCQACPALLDRAQLTALKTVEFTLSKETMPIVQQLVRIATGAHLKAASTHLLFRFGAGQTFGDTVSLRLDLSCLQTGSPLIRCLESFPVLIELELRLQYKGDAQAAVALYSVPSLRRLTLRGDGVHVDTKLVEAIACLSELESLSLNLQNIEFRTRMSRLGSLAKLEMCAFDFNSISDAPFVEDMHNLKALTLGIKYGGKGVLRLPEGLREFHCSSSFTPTLSLGPAAIGLVAVTLDAPSLLWVAREPQVLAGLECMTTSVNATYVPPLMQLLCDLGRLRSLCLEIQGHQSQLLLEHTTWSCPSVRSLTLKNCYPSHQAWSKSCPNARELNLWTELYADDDVTVFRLWRKLEKFTTHSKARGVTIVGKRQDGRLVKRWQDQSELL